MHHHLAHEGVLVMIIGRAFAIAKNTADQTGQMENHLRFDFRQHLPHPGLLEQIIIFAAGGDGIEPALAHQLDQIGAEKTGGAGDENAQGTIHGSGKNNL